ncbi:MAG: alcohol dehydrogenase catalytic domain-containing protein [Firmicutes bacterium]|nr:alcohol dehydrogenase catalytic domain-containing protein [Bacillota bacterium]
MGRLARAMVIEEHGRPLVLKEVEIPPLSEGEVLVKILASGVCGSDVHMWRGRDARNVLPMIPGHEGVGEVVEVCGEKRSVTGEPLRPGDRVIWDRGVTCGHCYYCAVLKEPSLCPERWAYGIHKPSSEFPYLNGCFASHLILQANTHIVNLRNYPPVVPAVLVAAACSGGTAAHAFALARPNVGDTVVVQGPGPLGAFSVDFARAAGASNVVVIGGTSERLEICREFGATCLLNRHDTTAEERIEVVKGLTGGRGADFVYETTGAAESVREGLAMLRAGGTYVTAGFGVPVGEVGVDWFRDIGCRNARIQGVWVSDAQHLLAAVSLVTAQPRKYERLVTCRFPLEDATRALEAVERREVMKAVLIP